MKSEDEECLVKEARLKVEKEEQARLKAEEEARLVEYARQKAKDHRNAQLKLEKRFRLALEARRRADEEGLGLKAEEASLKSKAEDQARLRSE